MCLSFLLVVTLKPYKHSHKCSFIDIVAPNPETLHILRFVTILFHSSVYFVQWFNFNTSYFLKTFFCVFTVRFYLNTPTPFTQRGRGRFN